MTVHRLDPAPHTTATAFCRDHEAVLRIAPGDRVVVHTLDAGGHLSPQTVPGEPQPRLHPDGRGHCLAWPIAVTGARPGDVLALELVDIRPGGWGWTRAGDAWLLWDLDADAGVGPESRGFARGLAPFLGVLGVAPAEPGDHSTIPHRPASGGNIDCRELVAGATLYLPVAVPDALLYLGDGHAAQGDGEVGGTAIECPMTTVFLIVGHRRVGVSVVLEG